MCTSKWLGTRTKGVNAPSCFKGEALEVLNLIRDGFPINRFIDDAKNLFNDMSNHEEFLKLDSKSRYGLTHPPLSEKDILAVSPLHSYLCVFRWLMLVIYHLDARTTKWSPISLRFKNR